MINKDTMVVNSDYLPMFFSANGNYSGEAVFVGYGFQINDKELKWDDYEGIDVKDKWGNSNGIVQKEINHIRYIQTILPFTKNDSR